MLTMNGITFTYPHAPEPLFENVDVAFPVGWTAVLGDNGIGKSTLMAIARGNALPDAGTVAPDPRRMIIGYCPQDTAVAPDNLEDFAVDWSPEAIAIRDDLGVADDWPYRYAQLSGGQQKRLQIACAMAMRPDALILDEPTNHVDAEAREHIIAAMRRYRGIGVAVSHDVKLIDATCVRCVMFERRHVSSRNMTVVTTLRGGYSEASQQVALRDGADTARADALQREAGRLAAVKAQRFAKVQQVESRKQHGERIDRRDHDARNRRQLAKMTGLDRGVTRAYSQLDGRLAAVKRQTEEISSPAKRYEGTIWMDIKPAHCREIVRLEPSLIRFGETAGDDEPMPSLCHAIQTGNRIRISLPENGDTATGLMIPAISIGPRDHVAVTGPNGAGKSSLVAALLAHAVDVPRLTIAQNTTDEDRNDAMNRLFALPAETRAQVLNAYARLDANPDRLLASGRPSPGELRKLLLCLALPSGPQLIVLDEPTNHLDLTSKKALARMLAEYPGALIVVSHDEWFLDLAGFGQETVAR
ncbi:ABC transporter ATP-binding protein [Bifidobacterium scaligerum]|uniref:ABC transporter ATP-binding protein n=2 Tax=Bifidobacterium scaligerum TaxID=2052656 RepID=A0A2M9HRW3_9BIFI|nr:ABC transporter ATP-binding protein [Bifidobacterium scaligerum]